MKLTFFLSPPRCRMAWLATYLTGMGVYCFHELWRDVDNIDDFKLAIASKGPGPVANADCSNWFFLPELREAFPEAQYILIDRPQADAWQSTADAYGGDTMVLSRAYERIRQQCPPLCTTIQFDAWDEAQSRLIMELVGPQVAFNEDWHTRMHQLHIQITAARIADDKQLASTGRLNHIGQRLMTP